MFEQVLQPLQDQRGIVFDLTLFDVRKVGLAFRDFENILRSLTISAIRPLAAGIFPQVYHSLLSLEATDRVERQRVVRIQVQRIVQIYLARNVLVAVHLVAE